MAKKSKTHFEPKIRRSSDKKSSRGSSQNQSDEASEPTQTQQERRANDRQKPLSSITLKGFGPNANPLEAPNPELAEPQQAPQESKEPKSHSKEAPRNRADATSPPPISSQTDFMTFEEGTSDDFAALFSEATALPQKKRYNLGDEVKGEIVTIGNELIYIDLGGSNEGVAKVSEFIDEDGNLPFAPGDTLTLFVTDFRGGVISLGLKLDASGPALEAIEQANLSGLPIEGRVTSANKGGFVVTIGDVETFCPISQIDLGFTEDPNVHIGNTYSFKVTDIREDGRNIIVSRAALLEQEAKEARKRLLDTLSPGDSVQGKVTRLTDFGAFVDIGGVEGLLHISEIGYGHIEHPSEALSEGDEVNVDILSIEEEKKGRLKISLSRKSRLKDPWIEIYNTFPIGTEVNGTVVRTEAFGAFVELAPGIEGLVHVSEMSWAKRIRHASDVVQDGDHVLVRVMEIDPQRRRISLSMKSLEADPWNDVKQNLSVGQEVTGTVDRVEDFGAFIRLAEPPVTALLPRSEMNLARNETPYSKAVKGTEITARILDIDSVRRRMALTLRSAAEIEDDKVHRGPQEPVSYSDTASGSGLGTFGDLLRAKLKEK